MFLTLYRRKHVAKIILGQRRDQFQDVLLFFLAKIRSLATLFLGGHWTPDRRGMIFATNEK